MKYPTWDQASDLVIDIHRGQLGGIHPPAHRYVLRSFSSTTGATLDTNHVFSTA
jgi:hypothetical protein